MVKKSFAANVVGAPTTVAPEETDKDVTICVQFTVTVSLSDAPVGSTMAPEAYVLTGVMISQTLPVLTVTLNPVAAGEAYCVFCVTVVTFAFT